MNFTAGPGLSGVQANGIDFRLFYVVEHPVLPSLFAARKPLNKLNSKVNSKSSRNIEIIWDRPSFSGAPVQFVYQIQIVDRVGNQRAVILPSSQTSYTFSTKPGYIYDITLRCLSKFQRAILAHAVFRNVKAIFSKNELNQLYQRVLDQYAATFQEFTVIYRCKPQAYWAFTHLVRWSQMEKYGKDNNGHRENAINRIIDGLFFNVRLQYDGTLPKKSPFGDMMLVLPADPFLNPKRHNMYFADYYCNYTTHYVTVVICVKGSDTDRYCFDTLKQLDPENNPLLRVQVKSPSLKYPEEVTYYVNKNVWVEVFVTESIPIHGATLRYVEATGYGASRFDGLPNNKRCEVCNLYPVRDGV